MFHMPLDQLAHLAHRGQARPVHPDQPSLHEASGPARAQVLPDVIQALLHGPGLGHLEVRRLQGFKGWSVFVRQVRLPVEPVVFRALEPVVILHRKLAVLLLANPIHRLAHVLHDVEPVVDDLLRRTRHMLERGLEIGLPHVHGHGLDPRQLILGELEVVPIKALGLTPFGHIHHRTADQIANHGHLVVPLAECLLVNAKISRGLRLFAFPAPAHRPSHDVPGFIPVNAHDTTRSGHRGALGQHVVNQPLNQQGKTSLELGSWRVDLKDAILGAVHSGSPSTHKRIELTRIQMGPNSGLGMISASMLPSAYRVRPTCSGSMLDADVHPPFNRVQLDSLDKPRFGQAKNPRIQDRVSHGCPPRRTLTGQLPTGKPEGPEKLGGVIFCVDIS